jgi:hypothetical protein
VHSLNILLISKTLDVLKLERFNSIKELHPLNMDFIFVTLIVIKLEIPNFFKDLHLLNILLISVTLLVSKLLKSNSSIQQDANILLILFNALVILASSNSMLRSEISVPFEDIIELRNKYDIFSTLLKSVLVKSIVIQLMVFTP